MKRRKKPTKDKIKIIGFPDDDQTWRIDWFDGVSLNPVVESDPTIRVMLTPVDIKTNPILQDWTTIWKNRKIIRLSVSYLNLISIGSTWRKGKLVSSLNSNTDNDNAFQVYIPSQNVVPIFKPIGTEAIEGNIRWNYSTFSNTQCLVLENCKFSFRNNQKVIGSVIIPCPELVRFYFATSTKLVRKIIFHSDVNLWNELVLVKDAEGNIRTDWSGPEMLLTLKTLIPNSDCWTIARLWTDVIAQREVNRLYRSMAGTVTMSQKAENLNIEMGFPFQGTSKLQVYGKISADRRSLLVLNIVACDADFLFSKLKLDRENSNKVKDKYTLVREVGFSNLRFSTLDNFGDVTLSNHSEPTKNVARQTMQDIKANPRFTKILEKEFEKVVKEKRKYRSAPSKIISPPPALTYGTGDGSYTADETQLPIDIVEDFKEKGNIDLTGGKDPGKKGDTNEARPYFIELIQAMRELQTLHNIYEFDWNVRSLPEGTKHKEMVMSIFPDPKPNEGPGSDWLNISKSQRRKILWFEVRRKKKYTYIVELDCKPTEHFAIYLLTYKGGIEASRAEINQVMSLWASDQKYCERKGLREHGKLSWEKKILSHKEPQKLAEKIWDRL